MRIVIDLQSMQGSFSLVQALIKNAKEHEILIALNGLLPETISPIREAFRDLLPQENIRVWYAPGPVAAFDPENSGRIEIAELIREAFLASLNPDIVLITGFFEGFVDDAVISVGRLTTRIPTAVVLYDLIPLSQSNHFKDSAFERWYENKIRQLYSADLILAGSASCAQDVIQQFSFPEESVFDIQGAAEPMAQCVINVLENFHIKNTALPSRPRLAFLSLPAYGAELLPELSRYYEIDVISDQEGTRDIKWFEKNLNRYQRILYHFGNSSFHQRLFPLLDKIPGVVVLHDFFLAGIINELDRELYRSHGYQAVSTCLNKGREHAIVEYPANLNVLEKALGIITHSTHYKDLAKKWYGSFDKKDWAIVPPLNVAYSPRQCADQYFAAIEKFYSHSVTNFSSLRNAISNLDRKPHTAREFLYLAKSIAQSIPPRFTQKQIFVDISELVRFDAKTGIQRVIRSILREWLINSSPNVRIEPVYADTEKPGYRYARAFTLDFLGYSNNLSLTDSPIEYRNGDIFLGLDLQMLVVPAQQQFYQGMRRHGVSVWFVVYDLLPVLMPHCFPEHAAMIYFPNWLSAIRENDGAICISKAVADDLVEWIQKNSLQRESPFKISWFNLGADINSRLLNLNNDGLTDGLIIDKRYPTFLMVGTIEPRKGHGQTLAAFEQLWREGYKLNLIITGKEGWMVEDLIKKIRGHHELNKQLFWLSNVSDKDLEAVYKASTCLIAASYGEGFGLPLIEAAQHGIPIIARSIPVFHEVTAGHAFYFTGAEPENLAESIKNWLLLFEQDSHPKSDNLPWKTWQQSAQQLLDIILTKNVPSLIT